MLQTHARHQFDQDSPSTLAAVGLGALAGTVGVIVLDKVDNALYSREGEESRERTNAVRPGGEPPAEVLAGRIERTAGLDFSKESHGQAGLAVHYSLGIGPAIAYALLRDRAPAITTGRGALFGLGLWLVEDEVLNPLLGLSAKPLEYPWQPHARGLVAHIAFGIAVEAVLRLLAGRPRRG